MSNKNQNIPLLPLRDVVIFPSVVTPLFVGREKSINALQAAMAGDKQIMLVAQKTAQQDDPKLGDLYPIGTLSTILQLIKLPDGTLKVLVEGNKRASIESLESSDDFMSVKVSSVEEEKDSEDSNHFLPSLKKQFQEYVKLTRKATPEVLNTVNAIDSLSRLTDTLVGHLSIDISQKQEILEMMSLTDRATRILEHLDSQLDLSKVEKKDSR
jgi:ATP-dependent Lon protease